MVKVRQGAGRCRGRLILEVAVGAEPVHGVGEGLLGRGLGEAEFVDGFGGVEIHFVQGHADAGQRRFGWFAGEFGTDFVDVGGEEGDAVGDLKSGCGDAGDFLQDGKGFFHAPIAGGVAQNVAFTYPAFFGGEDVADGDVANVDPVEAGVEVGGHLAVEEIDDDLTGGGGFDVAGSDRGAGVDDDDGETFGGEFAGEDFGAPFGDFVVIGKLAALDGGGFVGGRIKQTAIEFGKANTADGAGVNDAGAAGLGGGFEDILGAVNVGGIHGGVVLKPKMITGGDVEAPIAATQRGSEGRAVKDVASDALEVGAGETAEIAGGAEESLDAMTASEEFVDEIGTNETGGAGDETIHIRKELSMNEYENTRINLRGGGARVGGEGRRRAGLTFLGGEAAEILTSGAEFRNISGSRMPEKSCTRKKLSREEQKELDIKIDFMEGVVRRDPSYVEALQILGDDYTRRGKFVAGLKVDEQLSQLRPEDALVQYNLACSYSLTGNFNQAIAALEKALNLGYLDFKWLAQDPDLSELRQHPLYKNIRAKIRRMKAKKD
ncbi:MAG: Tetratricopeptide 2 repeat protein [Pedosphaera sp.]|nr:Tetratricopeptide 2 repeat protein [Pedosphaera sp.]